MIHSRALTILCACIASVCVACTSVADQPAAPPSSAEPAAPATVTAEQQTAKAANDLRDVADKQRKALSDIEQQIARLRNERTLREEQSKAGYADAERQITDIQMELNLRNAKASLERNLAETELAVLKARTDLDALRSKSQRQAAEGELAQLQLDSSLRQARAAAQLAASQAQVALLKAETELRETMMRNEASKLQEQIAAENARNALELARMNGEMELRAQRSKWKTAVPTPVAYDPQPFRDGVLTVSDRRIALNGMIGPGSGKYVSERIAFFNNQDPRDPIFIVIDSSPGGSVLEGYQILSAIDASSAPVHVVAKGFAASMAAVILTLAPNSYCLPNTLLLHHQMSSGTRGNLRQQREQLELTQEWFRRIGTPVAERMGMTVEQMVRKMYEANSDGDWILFGDKAREARWVQHVVGEIHEQGIVQNPESSSEPVVPTRIIRMTQAGATPSAATPPPPGAVYTGGYAPLVSGDALPELRDSENRPFVKLPRIAPVDAWFLYDPDDYYRN